MEVSNSPSYHLLYFRHFPALGLLISNRLNTFLFTERIRHIYTEKHHRARVKPRCDAMLFLEEQQHIIRSKHSKYPAWVLQQRFVFVAAIASWFQRSLLKGGEKTETKTASPTSLWDVKSIRMKRAKIGERGGLWRGGKRVILPPRVVCRQSRLYNC